MASSINLPNVSDLQMEALLEFLNSHRDIAMGYNASVETRIHYRRMWERVTQFLNSLEGDIMDWQGWSTYWVNYKAKLKKKVTALQAVNAQTGEGPSDAVPLTDIELKFYEILGNNNGLGTSCMPIDPFSEGMSLCHDNATSTPPEWMDENGNSTQSLYPVESSSSSTQSFNIETTSSAARRSLETRQRTASTEIRIAATQTTSAPAQASAGVMRRRRRPSTWSSLESRRSVAVAALAPNGFSRTNAYTGIVSVLTRMVRALERIEARLNGPQLSSV